MTTQCIAIKKAEFSKHLYVVVAQKQCMTNDLDLNLNHWYDSKQN